MSAWYDLVEEVTNTIDNEMKDLLENRYYQDRLTEIVDEAIPVYNSELLGLLSDNHSLAEVDDLGLLPENPDVYDIIRTAVYEQLSYEANRYFDNKKDNWDTCDECGDYFPANELNNNEEDEGVRVCDTCLVELTTCAECGNKFSADELAENNGMCNGCAEDFE